MVNINLLFLDFVSMLRYGLYGDISDELYSAVSLDYDISIIIERGDTFICRVVDRTSKLSLSDIYDIYEVCNDSLSNSVTVVDNCCFIKEIKDGMREFTLSYKFEM